MIECPDCGKNFRSAKCSCGYEPPKSNPAETAERMKAIRELTRIEHEQRCADFAKKQEVISTVRGGGMKKWAREVIALHEAGRYSCEYGVELAKTVLRREEKEAA